MNDNLNPEDVPSTENDEAAEDWRFAPPVSASDESDEAEAELMDSDAVEEEAAVAADEEFIADELDVDVAAPQTSDFPVLADSLDIDAALAAVSTLDDMLAEQEATEQARIARELAEEEARQQRELRLQNPELFFPMPTLLTVQRGRIDSVVPALVLILMGAWLTFTLTTTEALPEPVWLLLALAAGLGAITLARWLASGRWSAGMLFTALVFFLLGGALVALLMTGALVTGWPLLLTAVGVAFIIASVLLRGFDLRVFFPGLLLAIAGAAGYMVTGGWLPVEISTLVAGVWPVVLLVAVLVLVLPGLFRRQRQG